MLILAKELIQKIGRNQSSAPDLTRLEEISSNAKSPRFFAWGGCKQLICWRPTIQCARATAVAFILSTILPASSVGFAQDTGEACLIQEGSYLGEPMDVTYRAPIQSEETNKEAEGIFSNLFDSPIPLAPNRGPLGAQGLSGNMEKVGKKIASGSSSSNNSVHPQSPNKNSSEATSSDNNENTVLIRQWVYVDLKVRWRFSFEGEASVRLEPAGNAQFRRPADISAKQTESAASQLSAQRDSLVRWRKELSNDQVFKLIRGSDADVEIPGLVGAVEAPKPLPGLRLPSECAGLARLRLQRGKLKDILNSSQSRISRLNAIIDKEKKSGFLARNFGNSRIRRAERTLKREKQAQRPLKTNLARTERAINSRTRGLELEQRAAEIAAIKNDSKRLAAENTKRQKAMLEASKAAARARLQTIYGNTIYEQRIDFLRRWRKILSETDSDEAKVRPDEIDSMLENIQKSRSSWQSAMDRFLSARVQEQARLARENLRDGIGPTSAAQAVKNSTGRTGNGFSALSKNDFERAHNLAKKRVTADSRRNGDATSKTQSMYTFMADVHSQKLTGEEIGKRLSAYGLGVADASAKFVADTAKLAKDSLVAGVQITHDTVKQATGVDFTRDVGTDAPDSLQRGFEYLGGKNAAQIKRDVEKIANAISRRLDSAAAQGDKVLYEALRATGEGTAMVFAADAVAMQVFVRSGRVLRGLTKVDAPKPKSSGVDSLSKDVAAAAPAPNPTPSSTSPKSTDASLNQSPDTKTNLGKKEAPAVIAKTEQPAAKPTSQPDSVRPKTTPDSNQTAATSPTNTEPGALKSTDSAKQTGTNPATTEAKAPESANLRKQTAAEPTAKSDVDKPESATRTAQAKAKPVPAPQTNSTKSSRKASQREASPTKKTDMDQPKSASNSNQRRAKLKTESQTKQPRTALRTPPSRTTPKTRPNSATPQTSSMAKPLDRPSLPETIPTAPRRQLNGRPEGQQTAKLAKQNTPAQRQATAQNPQPDVTEPSGIVRARPRSDKPSANQRVNPPTQSARAPTPDATRTSQPATAKPDRAKRSQQTDVKPAASPVTAQPQRSARRQQPTAESADPLGQSIQDRSAKRQPHGRQSGKAPSQSIAKRPRQESASVPKASKNTARATPSDLATPTLESVVKRSPPNSQLKRSSPDISGDGLRKANELVAAAKRRLAKGDKTAAPELEAARKNLAEVVEARKADARGRELVEDLKQRDKIATKLKKEKKFKGLDPSDQMWLTGERTKLTPEELKWAKQTGDKYDGWEGVTKAYGKGELSPLDMNKFVAARQEMVTDMLDGVMAKIERSTGQKLNWDALGSRDPTSDFDISVTGPGAERVPGEFNKAFRETFKKEAGTYFDTNVYTDPIYNLSLDPDLAQSAKQFSRVQSPEYQQFLHSEMAQRKHMNDAQWADHKDRLMKAAGDDPGMQEVVQNATRQAEKMNTAQTKELLRRYDKIRKQRDPTYSPPVGKRDWKKIAKQDPDNLLRARNDLYDGSLREIDKLRQEREFLSQVGSKGDKTTATSKTDYLSGVPAYAEDISSIRRLQRAGGKANLAQAEKLKAKWNARIERSMITKQGDALWQAPEAYQTDGAISHVVGEIQAGGQKPTFSKLKETVTPDQSKAASYVNSINENRAMRHKEMNSAGYQPSTTDEKVLAKAAKKAAKYGVRELDAARRLGGDLKKLLPKLPSGESADRFLKAIADGAVNKGDAEIFDQVLKASGYDTYGKFLRDVSAATDGLTASALDRSAGLKKLAAETAESRAKKLASYGSN